MSSIHMGAKMQRCFNYLAVCVFKITFQSHFSLQRDLCQVSVCAVGTNDSRAVLSQLRTWPRAILRRILAHGLPSPKSNHDESYNSHSQTSTTTTTSYYI